jgi:hypothetical protein
MSMSTRRRGSTSDVKRGELVRATVALTWSSTVFLRGNGQRTVFRTSRVKSTDTRRDCAHPRDRPAGLGKKPAGDRVSLDRVAEFGVRRSIPRMNKL